MFAKLINTYRVDGPNYKFLSQTDPASCASCALIMDSKLFCCRKSQQAA